MTNNIKFCVQRPEARAEEVMKVIVQLDKEQTEMLNKAKKVLKEPHSNAICSICIKVSLVVKTMTENDVIKLTEINTKLSHNWSE